MNKKIRATDDKNSNAWRNRNKINLDLLWRIFYASLILAVVIGGYKMRIEALGIEQKAQAAELSVQEKRIATNEKDVVFTKTKIESIEKSMDTMVRTQEEMARDIKCLLGRRND